MPDEQKLKNVVAYARASCSDEETSLDDQINATRDWLAAQKLPWKIVLTIASGS